MGISAAESRVMEVLWERSPRTAEEVADAVTSEQDWTSATVKTLLNRLLNKEAISAERQGRRYLYRPILTRDAYVRSESQSLLDRLFEGRVAPLISHFSESKQLTARDVSELKRLIEDLDDDA